MEKASADMEFEKAAGLRDRIRALTNIQSTQGINPKGIRDADIIGLHRENAHACIQVFFIRGYQNWGNRDFYPRINLDNSDEEVLEAFVGQFYSDKETPKQIILSHQVENHDLVVNFLTEKLGKKVDIIIPRRGEKFEIPSTTLKSAKLALFAALPDPKWLKSAFFLLEPIPDIPSSGLETIFFARFAL